MRLVLASLLLLGLLAAARTEAGEGPDDARRIAGDVARALREKDDTQRAIQLEAALRGADSPEAAEVVLGRLLPRARNAVDSEIGVHALAGMRAEGVVELVAAAAGRGDDLAFRLLAVEVLGRSEADGASSTLLGLATDDDACLRAAAVTALGERHLAHHDEALEAALDDPDWRVRSAAIWALARQGRDDVVPALAARMRHEDGRLVDDCAAALRSVTGERYGARPGAYLRLWAERTGSAAPDLDEPWEAPAPSIVSPLLDTRSRRLLIVLSTGESMKEEVSPRALSAVEEVELRVAGEDLVEAYAAARTKMDVARIHATAMIRRLADGTLFDVAVYAGSPTFAFGELVAADARTREKAESRIARLSPGGGGNLSEMLRRAFDPRGKDPLLCARDDTTGPDTVVLFSDGRLAAPGVTDRNQVVMAVRRWNRVRQIRFVVVSLQPADDAVLGPLTGGPPSGVGIRLP